jgi:hypothetical protein
MIRGIVRAVLLAGAVVSIVGCIAVGGTDNQPTRGQELIDLKSALDRGAITQAEYEQTKAQIISRR